MKFYKSLIICLVFVFCSPIRSADLPEFNGKCLYTLEEGLNKIYEIANNRNLSLKINWIDDDIDNDSFTSVFLSLFCVFRKPVRKNFL